MTNSNALCDFEPLDRLARFSWDWAPTLCDPSHGCVDYHRSWSMVRWLELNRALPAGQAFFERELAGLAGAGKRRVLISGGADTGVTALVAAAYRLAGVEPEIVFVDQCASTIAQNSLFAAHLGLKIECIQTDIRKLDCPAVDAIVAHSFLLFFEGQMRQQVIAAWARNLRPNGVLLMSNSLAQDEGDWISIKNQEEILRRKNTLELAAKNAGFESSAAIEIAETAARFWQSSPSRPPAITAANLRTSLEQAGFCVQSILSANVAPVSGPMAMVRASTTTRARAEIIACKAGERSALLAAHCGAAPRPGLPNA